MKRPSVSEMVEARRCDSVSKDNMSARSRDAHTQFDIVEGGRYISDDPEDQPQACPRLPDDHGDVLASKAESDHTCEFVSQQLSMYDGQETTNRRNLSSNRQGKFHAHKHWRSGIHQQ